MTDKNKTQTDERAKEFMECLGNGKSIYEIEREENEREENDRQP
jgi:hypothetical protein